MTATGALPICGKTKWHIILYISNLLLLAEFTAICQCSMILKTVNQISACLCHCHVPNTTRLRIEKLEFCRVSNSKWKLSILVSILTFYISHSAAQPLSRSAAQPLSRSAAQPHSRSATQPEGVGR